MDSVSTKADFARNVAESYRILTEMRTEARLNWSAIDESRKILHDSWDILNRPDGGAKV